MDGTAVLFHKRYPLRQTLTACGYDHNKRHYDRRTVIPDRNFSKNLLLPGAGIRGVCPCHYMAL